MVEIESHLDYEENMEEYEWDSYEQAMVRIATCDICGGVGKSFNLDHKCYTCEGNGKIKYIYRG